MKTKTGTSDVHRHLEFEVELQRLGSDDLSTKHASRLTVDAALLRTGNIGEAEARYYKRVVLSYIRQRLLTCAPDEYRNFFQFLLQSELVDDSGEIRSALFDALTSLSEKPIDRVSLEISLSLLRSNKSPTSNVIRSWLSKVRKQYFQKPEWRLTGFLAACVGRDAEAVYAPSDFIKDLGLLYGPGFDKALCVRNPLWMRINCIPRLDAITILQSVERSRLAQSEQKPLNTMDIRPKKCLADIAYQPATA
jgi:hypothetical protein